MGAELASESVSFPLGAASASASAAAPKDFDVTRPPLVQQVLHVLEVLHVSPLIGGHGDGLRIFLNGGGHHLVDADDVAPLVVGFPVEARYGGGEHHFPGTIYQVNPTQYSTSEGIKWYPKGTFGVMYDDGDFEPAVPRNLIRARHPILGIPLRSRGP